MNSSRCPRRRSELHSDSSMILTTNSRAGWDIAWAPRPRPYHFPVHHARLVSSCLNSRDKKTAIRILFTARWMAITAMRPRMAREASHRSRYHCLPEFSMEVCNGWRTYQELKEGDHPNDAKHVCDECHDRSKQGKHRVQHRSQEQRYYEQRQQDRRIPHDWSQRNDSDADKSWCLLSTRCRKGLDKRVGDDEDHSHGDGEQDLRDDDGSPASSRYITGQLLRWMAKSLPLVPCNHGPRQTAIPNPRVTM
jgi:hypothetical protein